MNPTINIDWSEEGIIDKFDLSCPMGDMEYHERLAKKDKYCEGCSDNCGYIEPMMNYIWKLDKTYFASDEEKAKLRKKVSVMCGGVEVIESQEEEQFYLCLTGGGMDLSPQIALAYAIWDQWLPYSLALEIKAGWCKDSLGEKKYKFVKACVLKTLNNIKSYVEQNKAEWSKQYSEVHQ